MGCGRRGVFRENFLRALVLKDFFFLSSSLEGVRSFFLREGLGDLVFSLDQDRWVLIAFGMVDIFYLKGGGGAGICQVFEVPHPLHAGWTVVRMRREICFLVLFCFFLREKKITFGEME